MLHQPRVLLLGLAALAALGITTLACGAGTQIDDPQPNVEVVSPKSGLKVGATISSVSLGDGSAASLQLAFFANEASAAATVSIKSLVLVDASTKATVDTLTSSNPRVWSGASYEPWNERVTPGGDLKASYQLTTPSWSKIDSNGAVGRGSSRSYSTPFRLIVTLEIDGVEVVLESSELHREPVAVT
ncbi:MAG: hypothetical protein KF819_08395 [Labilithrix sp.]|nr:hypothetical protein [Labilithrix sp.]